jgi:hypothetical protein
MSASTRDRLTSFVRLDRQASARSTTPQPAAGQSHTILAKFTSGLRETKKKKKREGERKKRTVEGQFAEVSQGGYVAEVAQRERVVRHIQLRELRVRTQVVKAVINRLACLRIMRVSIRRNENAAYESDDKRETS